MSAFIKVTAAKDILPGQAKAFEVQGRQIAIFNIEGAFYAVDNRCTHAAGPLSEGLLEGDQVECPWHGARFDLKTGAALCAPASKGVATYQVRVNGSDVEVEVHV